MQFQHPSTLNPWQQYRQARAINKNTSRAGNSAWYQQPLEHDLQLHIRVDGPEVISSYFSRSGSQWLAGPMLTLDYLTEEQHFEGLAQELIKFARGRNAKSLGIILHIADEFAINELTPDLENPGSLADMRKTAVENPGAILDGNNFNTNDYAWRLVPYSAAGSGAVATTVTLSRQYARLFDALRVAGETANFPLISTALSAPLVALGGLSKMLDQQPQKPFVTILQYPWFTVLAFFNEHSDLKLIRTLQHRGLRSASNFRSALFTTTASLEFMDPDLFIVPLGKEIDDKLEANLRAQFPSCQVRSLPLPTTEGLPAWCPEPIIANQKSDKTDAVTSMTFPSLHDEGWTLQDFLPTPKQQAEIYPSRGEMQILRASKMACMLFILLALGGVGYFGFGAYKLMATDEWKFDPSQATATKAKQDKLNIERQQLDHWNNLLADRSKSWVIMESLVRLFPEKSGILIKDFAYSAKPDTNPGQAKVGFVKSWKISGFARDQANEYLNTTVNTREFINKHFAEIAELTGNEAFNTQVGNRSVSVNVRTRENGSFRDIPYEEAALTDQKSYPYTFELTITQRFESSDPLALNVAKAAAGH
ncbi:MAG TPA: hypothetical protein VFY13_09660 [Luteolibacter sp.]|nr:hypothetical protein [Luteolibacter sp.]